MNIRSKCKLFSVGYVVAVLGLCTATLTVSGNQSQIKSDAEEQCIYIECEQKSEELTTAPCSSPVNETVSDTDFIEGTVSPKSECKKVEIPEVITNFPSSSKKLADNLGVSCFEDMYSFQINKSYDIPKEFYYSVLPEEMYPLVEPVCQLEHREEVSSMYLLAVAATEVGWGKYFYDEGSNNWFNWTADAINYQVFESAWDCVEYTAGAYKERMFNPEWYAAFGQDVDDVFTVPEVNTRYALWNDGTVNWQWSEVVCEIMYGFVKDYEKWSISNDM